MAITDRIGPANPLFRAGRLIGLVGLEQNDFGAPDMDPLDSTLFRVDEHRGCIYPAQPPRVGSTGLNDATPLA